MALPLGVSLLRPLVALNLWTFGMEAWMYAYRIPAIHKHNLKVCFFSFNT